MASDWSIKHNFFPGFTVWTARTQRQRSPTGSLDTCQNECLSLLYLSARKLRKKQHRGSPFVSPPLHRTPLVRHAFCTGVRTRSLFRPECFNPGTEGKGQEKGGGAWQNFGGRGTQLENEVLCFAIFVCSSWKYILKNLNNFIDERHENFMLIKEDMAWVLKGSRNSGWSHWDGDSGGQYPASRQIR